MPNPTSGVTEQSHRPRASDAEARLRSRPNLRCSAPACDRASRRRATAGRLVSALLWLVPLAAAAEEATPTSPGAVIGRIFDITKLRNERPEPPDFVRQSRNPEADYVPLAPTDRANHRKTPAEMEAIDADLAAAAARNRAAAARVATPDVGPAPKAPAGKAKPGGAPAR